MELKGALKDQYHAALAMLRECVEKCPDDLWVSGEYPRFYWRIAFHAVFFTQVGVMQDEESYAPWPERRLGVYDRMWEEPAYVEPYELPEDAEVLSREELLKYMTFVDDLIDPVVDGLDMDSRESGTRMYPDFTMVSYQLMNLRHIQGHVGQLSELLMARGIDIEWIGKGRAAEWAAWKTKNP